MRRPCHLRHKSSAREAEREHLRRTVPGVSDEGNVKTCIASTNRNTGSSVRSLSVGAGRFRRPEQVGTGAIGPGSQAACTVAGIVLTRRLTAGSSGLLAIRHAAGSRYVHGLRCAGLDWNREPAAFAVPNATRVRASHGPAAVSWRRSYREVGSQRRFPAGLDRSRRARLGDGHGLGLSVQERIDDVIRPARASRGRILPQDPQEPGEVHVSPEQLGRVGVGLQARRSRHSEHEVHPDLGQLGEQP